MREWQVGYNPVVWACRFWLLFEADLFGDSDTPGRVVMAQHATFGLAGRAASVD